MPAVMWSATWQWYSQVPGSSGCMSALTIPAGRTCATSVPHAGGHHGVAVPVGRVQVDLCAHAHDVPADPVAAVWTADVRGRGYKRFLSTDEFCHGGSSEVAMKRAVDLFRFERRSWRLSMMVRKRQTLSEAA